MQTFSVARARNGTSYGDRDFSATPRATARDDSAGPSTATQSTARILQAPRQSMFRSLPSPVATTPAAPYEVFRADTGRTSDNCPHARTARKPVRGSGPHRDPPVYAAQKSGSRRPPDSCTGIDTAVVSSPPLLPSGLGSVFRTDLSEPLLSSIQNQFMCWPPFTARFAPVMKPASSEHRNATSAATSSGLPSRPAGICGRIFESRMSCGIAVTIFVAR